MARIVSMAPASGQVDDRITIEVEYDPTQDGSTPNVGSVVFTDGVDAPSFNVTDRDSTNRRLILTARVPTHAATGPIEVDLIGLPAIASATNFTVNAPNNQPFTILQIFPVAPAGGAYQRGTNLRFLMNSPTIQPGSMVYFANSPYGPPILRPTIPPQINQNQITVTIPNQAQLGRVKIQNGGGPDSALTRQALAFV